MFYKLDNEYIEYYDDSNPWTEIENDDDIAEFLKKYSFHDAYIESVMYSSGTIESNKGYTIIGNSYNMIITITSCWCGRIEFLFTKVRKFSLQGWSDHLHGNEMRDCLLKFRTDLWGKTRDDRVIVWADSSWFDPKSYRAEINLNDESYTYVIADGLKWRYVKEE